MFSLSVLVAAVFISGASAKIYPEELASLNQSHHELFEDYCMESRDFIIAQIRYHHNDWRYEELTQKLFGKHYLLMPGRDPEIEGGVFDHLSHYGLVEFCKVLVDISSQVKEIFESKKNELLSSSIDGDSKRLVSSINYDTVQCQAAHLLAVDNEFCKDYLSKTDNNDNSLNFPAL